MRIVAWALCLGVFVPGVAGADMRWTSSLLINEQYDDNVNFSQKQKQADYTTTVTPNMAFTGRSWDLDLNGNIGSTWTEYARRASSSAVSSTGGVTVKADALTGRLLRTWGLSVTENYSYTKELPTFAQFGSQVALSDSGIQTNRFNRFANNMGISTSYGLTEKTQLTGGYDNSLSRFSGNGTQTNSTSHALRGGWLQTLTTATSFHGDYTLRRFAFGGGPSTDTHAGDVGFKWQVRSDLTVNGTVGGTYLPSLDRINPNFDMGFAKQFQTSNLGANVSRSISNSGGLGALVSTQETRSAFASHQLTPSLSVNVSANYSATKSVGAQTVDVTSLGLLASASHQLTPSLSVNISANHATTRSVGVTAVDVTSLGLTPGLSYTIKRWLSMTAAYSYLKQESTGLVGSGLVRNTMTVGFTCTWP